MRQRLSLVVILFAWLAMNGTVWNVVQVFAWSRMFAGYARTLTVREALRETFDPEKPCDICRAVQKGRNAEQAQAPASLASGGEEKIFLASVTVDRFVFHPVKTEWPQPVAAALVSRTEPVPVPPPRV